jgi:hypothetical protein
MDNESFPPDADVLADTVPINLEELRHLLAEGGPAAL